MGSKPPKPDPTAPRRAARYEDRMRRRGFVKKHVWVPAEKMPEFEAMVENLRTEHSRVGTPDLKRIVSRLRRFEPELRREGIRHLGLFGSVARGESTPESDVDVLVTFDPKAKVGLFKLSGLGMRIEEILKRPVDLVSEKSLKDRVRANALKDIIEVF